MLREHGAQRPTVFELLNHVHGLRGTKSKFTYNIPVPPPLLPRHIPNSRPSPQLSTNNGTVMMSVKPSAPAYDGKTISAVPSPNQGIQARDKVLEAIAPMRRGRPASSRDSQSQSHSRQPSPQRTELARNWGDVEFAKEQDQAWKSVTEKVLGHDKNPRDGFNIPAGEQQQQQTRGGKTREASGFGDDFSDKLWRPSEVTPNNSAGPKISPRPSPGPLSSKPQPSGISPIAFTGTTMLRPKQDRIIQNRNKDAFDGLGLITSASKPAPTLGEARKLRTGLAVMNVSSTQKSHYLRQEPFKPSSVSPNPTPSPKPNYLSTGTSQPQSRSPVPSPTPSMSGGWNPSTPNVTSAPSSSKPDGLPIESRFPSLEELDARFVPGSNVNALYPSYVGNTNFNVPASRVNEGRRSNIASAGLLAPSTAASNGVRSEQVTGVAMREPKESRKQDEWSPKPTISTPPNAAPSPAPAPASAPSDMAGFRPTSSRLQSTLTTATFKEAIKPFSVDFSMNSKLVDHEPPPKLPSQSPAHSTSQDWLTGADFDDAKRANEPDVPILRESPRKRASFIEGNDEHIVSSSSAQHVYAAEKSMDEPQSADLSPTVSKFKRAFPAIDNLDIRSSRTEAVGTGLTDNWSPVVERRKSVEASSSDEGPEEPNLRRSLAIRQGPAKLKMRQSSVHELAHQYGSAPTQSKLKEKEKAPTQVDVSLLLPKIRPLETSGSTKDRAIKAPPPISKDSKPQFLNERSTNDGPPVPPPSSMKPSISASRSRPQSMFLFPSKPVESITPPNKNTSLAPPKETKPRPTRRTSISDMVQHYETIGGASKPADSGPASPSPLYKPSAYTSFPKPPSPTTYTAPISKVPSQSDYSRGRLPISKEPESYRPDSSKAAPMSEQSSFPGPSRSPVKQASIEAESNTTTAYAASIPPPRQRRMSTKAEAYINSVNALEAEISRPKKSVAESPRKANLFSSAPATAESSSSLLNKQEIDRSPSPERPYQGVGKLIDQWQRKTAEADQGKLPPKRTPLNGLR